MVGYYVGDAATISVVVNGVPTTLSTATWSVNPREVLGLAATPTAIRHLQPSTALNRRQRNWCTLPVRERSPKSGVRQKDAAAE